MLGQWTERRVDASKVTSAIWVDSTFVILNADFVSGERGNRPDLFDSREQVGGVAFRPLEAGILDALGVSLKIV